jgi:FkbM family methyltransferase
MTTYSSLKYAKYYLSLLLSHWFATKKSYSQHGEDLLVEHILGPGAIRSFIDIGANDGVLFSNTYKFAKTGAHGLCIEPCSSTFLKLRLNHLFHLRVKCLRVAASNRSGSIPFLKDGYEEILSRVADPSCSQAEDQSSHEPTITVPTLTLEQILHKYSRFQQTDLLSVDVEGHERQVFEGLQNCPFQARAIILETDKTDIEGILSLPSLKEYIPRYTNGVNLILLHKNESDVHQATNKSLPGNFHPC